MKNTSIFAMLCVVLLLSSCRRELQESIQSAEDNAQIETEFSSVYDVVADYASTDSRTGKTDDYILPSGAVVTFTDSLFTDGDGIVFSINYGPLNTGGSSKGMLCKDGRYRAGKVNVQMDKRWSEIPCNIIISISSNDNYYAGNGTNMYQITGTKTVTRTAANSYTVVVSDATMQRDNGTVQWNAQRTITRTFDNGPGWLGDEYEISGNATGNNANGDDFTVETKSSLKKKFALGCFSTFVAGELELTNSNGKVLNINYDPFGNEACDKTVRITYNGRSRDITLW